MNESCLNCKSQYICRSYIKLYEALNSSEYKTAVDDSRLMPGVHGQCYQATASNCSYYEGDGE